ncbi:MAG TPA: ribosome silencing factor [Actinomycetota bacterium]|nr:ribosome silencing factor [Actinomycetota bacterium]
MPGRKNGSESSRGDALAAARAAASKQAEDIVILDVQGLIVITDYFVICSASSDRHVRTVVDEVERSLRDRERKPVRREGETEGKWVLLDYVDLVVHVFAEAEREFYDLERLWRDAPRVPVGDAAPQGQAAGGSLD